MKKIVNTLKENSNKSEITSQSNWTDEKNERRCDLIDKSIDSSLTREEFDELKILQEEVLAYRFEVAPLDDLRKVMEEYGL